MFDRMKGIIMPKLVRLYIKNVLIGFVIAALFVALLITFDIAGLRHLLTSSPAGYLAIVMLWFANGIVFAGVQFAIAVMAMREKDTGPRGGRKQPVVQMTPSPVRAENHKPRSL